MAMGGTPPLPPLKVLALADRLQWACEDEECLAVVGALDDCWREMQQKKAGMKNPTVVGLVLITALALPRHTKPSRT